MSAKTPWPSPADLVFLMCMITIKGWNILARAQASLRPRLDKQRRNLKYNTRPNRLCLPKFASRVNKVSAGQSYGGEYKYHIFEHFLVLSKSLNIKKTRHKGLIVKDSYTYVIHCGPNCKTHPSMNT